MKTSEITTNEHPAYLRQAEAARYCGISLPLLGKLERHGAGPRKIKLGRAALYRIADLETWLRQHELGRVR